MGRGGTRGGWCNGRASGTALTRRRVREPSQAGVGAGTLGLLLGWAQACRGEGAVNIQGLLEIKDTHRTWGDPMLLGIALL